MITSIILHKISKHLNILDLSQLVQVNQHTFIILTEEFYNRLSDYNFFIITKSDDNYYTSIIKNIISIYQDNEIIIELTKDNIIISKDKTDPCIMLSKDICKYYCCEHELSFKINLFKMDRIVDNLQLFDKFYIYKEINDNKIHIFISNKYNPKFKIHYKIFI